MSTLNKKMASPRCKVRRNQIQENQAKDKAKIPPPTTLLKF
jgi:hypothetical protein